MDPVAAAIVLTITVLWASYGIGLLREWLDLRRAECPTQLPAGDEECPYAGGSCPEIDRRRLN